ncbi:hypothetical protein ACVWWJ_001855 [Luteibacter sp. HA06]
MNFPRTRYGVVWSNLEVFEGETLKTDIDMVLRLGRRVGIAECRSRAGFGEAPLRALPDASHEERICLLFDLAVAG